jgi:hypothetical protein
MKDVQSRAFKVAIIAPWTFFALNAINGIMILSNYCEEDKRELIMSVSRSAIILALAISCSSGVLLFKSGKSNLLVTSLVTFMYLVVCSTIVVAAYYYTDQDYFKNGIGKEFLYTLKFLNFLIHLIFTMFVALFRPGYGTITLLTSIISVSSEVIMD